MLKILEQHRQSFYYFRSGILLFIYCGCTFEFSFSAYAANKFLTNRHKKLISQCMPNKHVNNELFYRIQIISIRRQIKWQNIMKNLRSFLILAGLPYERKRICPITAKFQYRTQSSRPRPAHGSAS